MKALSSGELVLYLCSVISLLTKTSANSEVPPLLRKPSVKLLVIGQTGSGKSTLINTLLGRYIASVGDELEPETETVSVYKEEINDVSVTACDTPGLRDASGKEKNYMNKINSSCDNPDLVLFCLRMDTTRWQDDDTEAIKIVTEHLGKDIWKHSVLVLTHADKIINSDIPLKQQIDFFDKKKSKLKEKFINAINNAGAPVHSIPVAVSAKLKCGEYLPGVKNWMSELLVTCLGRTTERGKEGILQIVLNRINLPEEVDKDDCKKPEYEQSFVFTESLCSLLKL